MAHTIDNYKKEEKENEKVNIINHKEFEPKSLILNNIETEYTNNKIITTNNNKNNLRPKSVHENIAFDLMNKSIKQFTHKANYYDNLNFQEIPDNKLYNCLIKIIDGMKNSNDYKIVSGVNNTLLSNNMKILPLQNKEFRKDFMDKLFNDYELLSAFEEVENKFVDKHFNKLLFEK